MSEEQYEIVTNVRAERIKESIYKVFSRPHEATKIFNEYFLRIQGDFEKKYISSNFRLLWIDDNKIVLLSETLLSKTFKKIGFLLPSKLTSFTAEFLEITFEFSEKYSSVFWHYFSTIAFDSENYSINNYLKIESKKYELSETMWFLHFTESEKKTRLSFTGCLVNGKKQEKKLFCPLASEWLEQLIKSLESQPDPMEIEIAEKHSQIKQEYQQKFQLLKRKNEEYKTKLSQQKNMDEIKEQLESEIPLLKKLFTIDPNAHRLIVTAEFEYHGYSSINSEYAAFSQIIILYSSFVEAILREQLGDKIKRSFYRGKKWYGFNIESENKLIMPGNNLDSWIQLQESQCKDYMNWIDSRYRNDNSMIVFLKNHLGKIVKEIKEGRNPSSHGDAMTFDDVKYVRDVILYKECCCGEPFINFLLKLYD